MKPEIIKFLRGEATKFYRQLDNATRSRVTEKQIYLELKASWKAGAKVPREARDRAKDMPMNFKEMSPELKNQVLSQESVVDAAMGALEDPGQRSSEISGYEEGAG